MAKLVFNAAEPQVPGTDTHDLRTLFQDQRFGVYESFETPTKKVKNICVSPNTGTRYSTADLETSLSFDEAMEEIEHLKAAHHGADIEYGLILFMPETLLCVDFDGTDDFDPDSEEYAAHMDLMTEAPTWVERSVSGVGYHAFYSLEPIEYSTLTNTNDHDLNIDTRVKGGFVFLTGNIREGFDLPIAPYSSLPVNFRRHLVQRCLPNLEAHRSQLPWELDNTKADTDVIATMFMRYPQSAKYLFTTQSQEGMSEMIYGPLKDLIRTSMNYEQVKRIYDQSPAGLIENASPKRQHNKSAFDSWKKRCINKAGADLLAEGRFFNPTDYNVYITETDDAKSWIPTRTREMSEYAETDWIVKGVVPAEGTMLLYGPSGSGKTFLTLDLAMTIARGEEWFGLKTRKVPISYFGLEGETGIHNRVYGYNKHYAQTHLDEAGNPIENPGCFDVYRRPLNLRDDAMVDNVISAVKMQGCEKGLIIIDTLAKSAQGMDENAGKDATLYMGNVARIARETSCIVALVHHTGKDTEKGARGHSSIIAGVDSAIEVVVARDKAGNPIGRSWTVKKSKDGEDGGNYRFGLEVVEIGYDQWGDTETTCVIDTNPTDGADAAANLIAGFDISDDDCQWVAYYLESLPHIPIKDTSTHAYSFYTQFNRMEDFPWPGDRKRTHAVVMAAIERGFITAEAAVDEQGKEYRWLKPLVCS